MAADAQPTQVAELSKGWPVLVATVLGNGAGLAALPFYVLSSFMAPLQQQFGWSRAAIGSAATVLGIGMFLTFAITGKIIDRFGARRVAMMAIPPYACMFALLSRLGPHIAVLYALYAALAVVGGATTSIAYAGIVSTWFVRRRGLALGIMASGGGITAMLVPVVLDRVIDAYGWQAAWLACTAIAALPLPFIALLIRGQPPRSALPLRNASPANADGVTLQAAIRSRAFWLLAAAVLLFTSAAAGLIVHLKPLMQDFGLSPFRAAQISGLLGVGLLVGRLCTGYLLDLVVASHLAAGVMLTAAIGFSILALHSPAVAFLGVLCVGLTLGAEGDILAFLAARHFGLRSYAEIFGWLFGIMALGTASGPLIAGLLYDLGGDYRTTLCLFTAHCLLAALCFCFLDPAPGTRSEVASINLNVL